MPLDQKYIYRIGRDSNPAQNGTYILMYKYMSNSSNFNNLMEYAFHTVALHIWQIPYLQNMWPKLHMFRKLLKDR